MNIGLNGGKATVEPIRTFLMEGDSNCRKSLSRDRTSTINPNNHSQTPLTRCLTTLRSATAAAPVSPLFQSVPVIHRCTQRATQQCMASQKSQCDKYKYIVTPTGPAIVQVHEASVFEESASDYNAGGYLPIQPSDTFKDGRYVVLRKLG